MRRLFGFQFATDIVTRLSRSNLKGGLPRRVLIECFKQRSKRDDEVEDENERKKRKKENTMELVRGATNFVEMVTMGWQVTGK